MEQCPPSNEELHDLVQQLTEQQEEDEDEEERGTKKMQKKALTDNLSSIGIDLAPGGGRDFPHPSRPAPGGPTQPPIQCVPDLSCG
jgi:hypothetical protein